VPERKKERPFIRATPWKKSLPDQALDLIGEPPAYVKRALRVERAVEALFRPAERHHAKLKRFVDWRRREWEAARGHPKKEMRLQKRLAETVARCNARWIKWLEADGRFDAVNREIEGFNRYYMLERQAALKWVPLKAAQVEKKKPLGSADVLARFGPYHVRG